MIKCEIDAKLVQMINRFPKNVITTFTGKQFDPFDFSENDIVLEDLIRAASNTCRFGGLIEKFYSVAQHSILCGKLVRNNYKPIDKHLILAAYCHDFSESISPLGDIPSPAKKRFLFLLLTK